MFTHVLGVDNPTWKSESEQGDRDQKRKKGQRAIFNKKSGSKVTY